MDKMDKMDKTKLKRKSKQGAIMSFVGFLIVGLTIIYSIFQLKIVNKKLSFKETELQKLDSTIVFKNREITYKQGLIDELVTEINKLKNPEIKPKSKSVPLPGVKSQDGRPVYDFSLWITSSNFTLNKIRKVKYEFNHNTFILKNRESNDKSNGFAVNYRGWGCLKLVKINIEFNNGDIESIYYKMCEELIRE